MKSFDGLLKTGWEFRGVSNWASISHQWPDGKTGQLFLQVIYFERDGDLISYQQRVDASGAVSWELQDL